MKNKNKNQTITMCLGIPASGKSTWGDKFVRENEKYVKICRDSYRFMLKDSPFLDPKGENFVTDLVYKSTISALNNKYNVIIDQTNCNIRHLNNFIDTMQYYADIEFKIFDIDVKTAIERDKNRERSVGEEVIKKMYKDYLNLFDSNFDFSVRKKKPRILGTKIPQNNLPKAVIFDVDGTLAHANGKRHYFDWKSVYKDDLDEAVKHQAENHYQLGHIVIVLTGRDGSCEEETKEWLELHDIPFDKLYLRPAGDYRKDTVVKAEIYNDHIKDNYNVIAVYEDRMQTTRMWREIGLKCYQVEESD